MSRVRVAPTGAVVLALAVANIAFTGSTPATAANGDPVIAGQYVQATFDTRIENVGSGGAFW